MLASAIAESLGSGGASQMGACGPPGGHDWCAGEYENAMFNPEWGAPPKLGLTCTRPAWLTPVSWGRKFARQQARTRLQRSRRLASAGGVRQSQDRADPAVWNSFLAPHTRLSRLERTLRPVPRSALIVAVPEAEPLVGGWRLRYDDASLGVPAHVTLLFPFMPAEELGEALLG